MTSQPLVMSIRSGLLCLFVIAACQITFGQEADGGLTKKVAPKFDPEEFSLMLKEGDYEDAEEYLQEFDSADPSTLLMPRAQLHLIHGRFKSVEDLFESTANDLDSEQQLLLANAEIGQAKWQAARKRLQSLLKKDSNNVEALVQLGEVLETLGDRESAHTHYQKVIGIYQAMGYKQVEKSPAELFVWMGKACVALNRRGDAYSVLYSTAFDLDEDSVEAHTASGYVMLKAYNYPDARSHFKDALKINPNSVDANIGLARATIIDYGYPRDRFGDTRLRLRVVDRVYRNHPESLLLHGEMDFYEENWVQAESKFRKVIEKDPFNQYAYAQLAALLYTNSRLAEFEKLEAEMNERFSKPAPFYTALAERLVNRFFYYEAVIYSRKAIEADPEYWPAYVVRGVNALRIGENAEGKKWTKLAFKNDRYNLWAKNTIILIKQIEKHFTEVKTENFLIRLRHEDAPFMLPYLQPILEEAHDHLSKKYQVEVFKPITVESFSSHRYFSARSIGLPGLAASGVCFGRMVTLTTPRALPGNWGAVAIHEFEHVVSLAKSGQRVPRWFTEGLSTYEEGMNRPTWERRFCDEYADAVLSGGILKMADIQQAFSKPKYPGQILLGYYQGCVMCGYFESRHGLDAIRKMLTAYRNGKNTEQVFAEILNLSLEQFDAEFLKYSQELVKSWGLYGKYNLRDVDALKIEVEDKPKSVESWTKLALAYFFAGKEADAELSIGKALKLNPEYGDLLAVQAFLNLKKGRLKAALEKFEAALKNSTNYRYRCQYGIALIQKKNNNTSAAIDSLRKAIAIHPMGTRPRFGSKNPYLLLASWLEAEDQIEEAIQVYRAQISYANDDLRTRIKLAEHYTVKEDYNSVVAVLADGPYIDPFVDKVHRLLAKAYVEVESYELALRELTVLTAFENPPLNLIYPEIAWCHFKMGEHLKALEYAQKAQRMDPANERAKEILKALKR